MSLQRLFSLVDIANIGITHAQMMPEISALRLPGNKLFHDGQIFLKSLQRLFSLTLGLVDMTHIVITRAQITPEISALRIPGN